MSPASMTGASFGRKILCFNHSTPSPTLGGAWRKSHRMTGLSSFVQSGIWTGSRKPLATWPDPRTNGPFEKLPARGISSGRAWSACSPAFGGHPASIVPAAYSSVPKTGQNRRTSRPHLALRGTTRHYVALRGTRRPLHVRVHARSKDLWDRHVVPSSPAPARRPRTTSGSASYSGRQRTVKTSRIGR